MTIDNRPHTVVSGKNVIIAGEVHVAGDLIIEASRRTFCRMIGTLAVICLCGSPIGYLMWRDHREKRTRTEEALLTRFFRPDKGSSSDALLPANKHPIQPLSNESSFYKIEKDVADDYVKAFGQTHRLVQSMNKVRDVDNLVLFGSQVSNPTTRYYLGDPYEEDAIFQITSPRNDWRVNLHWNLHKIRNGQIREVRQYDGPWKFQESVFCTKDGDHFKSDFVDNEQQNDYLLITSLPRFSSGGHILIFAGLHGPGTMAASDLLLGRAFEELQSFNAGKDRVNGPFYQALLEVRVQKDNCGNCIPAKISFVGAKTLEVDFSRGA